MRVTVAVLVGIIALCLVIAYGVRPPAITPPPVLPPPKPMVDSDANCAAIKKAYEAELAKVQGCSRDDECVVDARGGTMSGLDRCARFHRPDANLTKVDAVADAWLARGCAHVFMTCAPERAQCAAGTCAELPPAPIPATWHRVGFRESFSFFVPPDAIEQEVQGEDSYVGEWKTPRSTIMFDYGQYGTNIEGTPGEDTTVRRERIIVGDSVGQLIATREKRGVFVVGVHFQQLQNSISHYESVLTLWTDCKSEAQCSDGYLTARSLELH